MKLVRARFLLASLFLISFLLQVGMLLNLVRQQALTLQEAGHSLELLGKLYSVPGTMVIVGAFARSTSHPAQEKVLAFNVLYCAWCFDHLELFLSGRGMAVLQRE
jgi:hypothetical protein